MGSVSWHDCIADCNLSDEVIDMKKITLHINGRTYEVNSLAQAVNMILHDSKKGDENGKLSR